MVQNLDAFLARLRADMQDALPGRSAQVRMAPRPRTGVQIDEHPRGDTRKGGVLALLYPHAGALWLPFILRATYNGVHSGQIGLPGGGHEPGDADLVETALREAYEEVGVPPDSVQVLGKLSTLYIPPSNFLVHPVVGFTSERPHFRLDRYEVADLIEVDLADLLEPANLRTEVRALRDQRPADVPYFGVQDHIIWGATAMILGEFLALPALRAYTALTDRTPVSKTQ